MNVERLHALLAEVRDDLRETNMKGKLEDLDNALQRAVSSPAEPSFQNAVAEAREAVRAGLQSSAVNQMPPASLEVLEELGILPCLGEYLLDEFDDIFQRNQVTQAVVLEEVQGIVVRYQEIAKHLDEMLAGMAYFEIGSDDLDPGDCEITMVIPRPFVRNSLQPLGEEFRRIRKILGPFQELATGSREEIHVRTISSSDFLLGMAVDPNTGAAFAQAVAWVLARYKDVLGIRKMVEEIRQMDLPEERAQDLETDATNMIVNSIGEITGSLMTQYEGNLNGTGRANEVKTELTVAIIETARRIDVGFQMQVRAIPPETQEVEDGGEGSDEPVVDLTAYETIEELRPNIEFLKLEGSPILALEEGEGFADDPPPGAA